jgi:parvulin-like peptidyl-prolyl isomerase
MKYKKLIIIIFLFVLSGCSERKPGNVLARVNNEYLTEERLNLLPMKIASEQTMLDEKKEIVEQWIYLELLYQEGVKNRIDKNPEIKNQVLQYQKQLIASQYLSLVVGDQLTAEDEEINDYYFENREQFKVSELTYKVNHYAFTEESTARNAYRSLVRNDREKIQEFKEKNLVETRFIEENFVIPAVRDRLFSVPPPRISEPFLLSDAYHVFEILETYSPNSYLPISEVREDIRQQIGLQKSDEAYYSLLNKLRKKAHVETYF